MTDYYEWDNASCDFNRITLAEILDQEGLGDIREKADMIVDQIGIEHCKHEDVDWWDGLGEKHDGDEWDVTCAICDKQYTVSMCITTTFATKEASND